MPYSKPADEEIGHDVPGALLAHVRDLFSRNKKAREIERALTVLEEAGRLQRTTVTDGRGRPAETWLPATPARAA